MIPATQNSVAMSGDSQSVQQHVETKGPRGAAGFTRELAKDLLLKAVLIGVGVAIGRANVIYKAVTHQAVPAQMNGATLCTTSTAGVCFDVDGLGGTLFVGGDAFNIVSVERLGLQDVRLHLSCVSNGASATARVQWSENSTYYMTVYFPDGRSETYILHQAR